MRYLITFSYDGTNFSGYQTQPNKRTIEEEIEKILYKINSNKNVKIIASGRTDAHVHALNQKAHFDLDMNIDCSKLKKSLNDLLPPDIYIKSVENVSETFHARYGVIKKTYTYKINLGEYSPIECNYIYQYNKELDIKKIEQALSMIEGTHNFKSFTKGDTIKQSYERTIYEAKLSLTNEILEISLTGDGFMRYMVRNIVGTLIELGSGKIELKEIEKIFVSEDRTTAGITASPCGLYLKDVIY